MAFWGLAAAAGEAAMRELALFAGTGFLILGLGDLAVDLLWIAIVLKRRFAVPRGKRARADTLAPPLSPGRMAIFVPAWDESKVIGAMLRHALEAFGTQDYVIYVGCYPNDPATIEAVRALADERVNPVVGLSDGPTSKADCLNSIWERMQCDEAAEGRRFKAVVLHDAEDVVHSAELGVFDTLIERFDLVQLPVLPLIDRQSVLVGAHYADEFAEAHGKELVVREALGAGLPSAGVGCAIARDALDRMAAAHGTPFDPASLTEDYELGLRLGAMGGRGAFVRIPGGPERPLVATRGYFPNHWRAAVKQKARWMTGIALAGWDRLGWNGDFSERWMRLRDRQSPLAALLLASAYLTLALWTIFSLLQIFTGRQVQPLSAFLSALLTINLGLLLWRLAMRFGFVTRSYGWRQGLLSIPRVLIGNAIAMLAAREALTRYLGLRRTGRSAWGKTDHVFPQQVPAE